jgi:putative transposase
MKSYQVADAKNSEKLARFLAGEGQLLLPMLDLITQAELAVDELIDVMGRATIEAVLQMSAAEVAGDRHPGKKTGKVRRHGRQQGVVPLAERKLRVRRPRLRRKGEGQGAEVAIPAYEAMQGNARLGRRMLEILMAGVSTRKYKEILPEMAETVGVSKSSVSRQFIEASESALRGLCERRFEETDLLIVYLDGLQFGSVHVVVALGVDTSGQKHVLGLREGGSENAAVVKGLLEDLVARGLKPGRRRLFVIDGSKALRAAIDAVLGAGNPVQRCRKHKERNVLDHLPKERRDQVLCTLRAAWKLEAAEGMKRLEQLATWLDQEYPSAAGSLREGLAEMFTINRLKLPGSLRRCLSSTNVIESSFSGARSKTGRVRHWRDGSMVCRWTATALLATEKKFRRIMGYQQLWMLEAHLKEDSSEATIASERKVG